MVCVEIGGVGQRIESADGLLHVERSGFDGVPGFGCGHQREFAAVDHLFGIIRRQVQFAHRPVGAGQQRLHGVKVEVGDAAARKSVGGVGARGGDQAFVFGEIPFRVGQVLDNLFEDFVQRTVRGDFDAVLGHVGNRFGLGRSVPRGERHGEQARHLEVQERAQCEQLALVEFHVAVFGVRLGQDVHQGLVDVADDLVACDPDILGGGNGVCLLPLALDEVSRVVVRVHGEVADHQFGVLEREHHAEQAVSVREVAHLGIDAVDGVLTAFGCRKELLVGHFRFWVDIEVSLAAAQQREPYIFMRVIISAF